MGYMNEDERTQFEKDLAFNRRVRKINEVILGVTFVAGCFMFGTALFIIGHFVYKFW